MEKKNELLIRAYLVMLSFVMFAAVIMWKVFVISVVEGDEWRQKGNKYVKWADIEATRGSIFSEDGHVWSTSSQFFEIRIDPFAPSERNFEKQIDSLCIYLERYADGVRSKSEWKSLLVNKRKAYKLRKEKGSRNILLAKQASYDLFRKFKSFPLLRHGSNGGGLKITRFAERVHPYQQMAARTIGNYRETADKTGIEGFWDKQLAGEETKRLVKKVGGGVWIPVYDVAEEDLKKGSDLMVTLDVDIQDIVHNELLEAVEHQEAYGGTAIVMEVETGAIKAMSNFSKKRNGEYGDVKNHAVGTRVEPGSTFKLATIMALIDEGHVNLDSKVDITGGVKKFYKQVMRDDHRPTNNIIDLKTAFSTSSNVGIATYAHRAYGKKENWKNFYDKLNFFRLTQPTGIAIEGEPAPLIRNPSFDGNWSGVSVPWIAHGYEIEVTPLQTLTLYSAVANGGTMMRPYLVKEIIDPEGNVRHIKPEVLRSSIAKFSTIEQVKECLEEVVISGTGKKLKSDKYDFAGKTGTSRVNYDKPDERPKYNASFVGYFPADNPKYSVIVMIYDPKKDFYGSSAAGPVFRSITDRMYAIRPELQKSINEKQILDVKHLPKVAMGNGKDFDKVFDYVGIDYKKEVKANWIVAKANTDRMLVDKQKIKMKEVPDVRNMGLRDALYVLENLGLDVRIHGSGKVGKQSLKPGSTITGQEIEIYLN